MSDANLMQNNNLDGLLRQSQSYNLSPSRSPIRLPSISPLPVIPSLSTSLATPLGTSLGVPLSSMPSSPMQLSPKLASVTPNIEATGVGSSVTRESYGTPSMAPIYAPQPVMAPVLAAPVLSPVLSPVLGSTQQIPSSIQPVRAPSLVPSLVPSIVPSQQLVPSPTRVSLPQFVSPQFVPSQSVSPQFVSPQFGSQQLVPSQIPAPILTPIVSSPRLTRITPSPNQMFASPLSSSAPVSVRALSSLGQPVSPQRSPSLVPTPTIVPSPTIRHLMPSSPLSPTSPLLIPPSPRPVSLPVPVSVPMMSAPSVVSPGVFPILSPGVSPILSPGISPIVSTPSVLGTMARQQAIVPSLTMGMQQATTPSAAQALTQASSAQAIQFATPQGMVENQDILRLLAEKGFMPFNTIMVNESNGLTARYVKAIDKHGNTSYILIDIDGNIMTQPGDLTTIQTSTATSIPLSAKVGAYDCVGLDVCAVALECEDGVCVLMRDDEANMKEIMLEKEKKRADEALIESDSPLAYPVVRLSEIIENPTLVLKIIDDTTVKMRRAAIKNYLAMVTELEGGVSRNPGKHVVGVRCMANERVELFVKKMDKVLSTLAAKQKDLECQRNRYDTMPCMNDAQLEQYRQITAKIRVNNDLINNLLKLARNMQRYITIYNSISADADEFNKFIDDAFMKHLC